MQYGNGKVYDVDFDGNIKFKSYYVVWKLYNQTIQQIFYEMFKSYYVVWKLLRAIFCAASRLSLNRTMQYGN